MISSAINSGVTPEEAAKLAAEARGLKAIAELKMAEEIMILARDSIAVDDPISMHRIVSALKETREAIVLLEEIARDYEIQSDREFFTRV